MCSPQLMAVTGAAQAGLGQVQANRAARASEVASLREERAVNRETAYQQNDLNRRLTENRRARAAEIENVARESLRRVGTATVAGAEGGVAGEALGAIIRDFLGAREDFNTGVAINERQDTVQTRLAAEGLERNRQNRVLQARTRRIPRPSLLSSILATAGGAAQGAALGRQLRVG